MNRTILCMAIALAALAPTRFASAQDAPTPEQLDQAKKAFAEGKALHDQGKLTEAIEKFKESYRLSKNPLLLYNIGLTLDEASQKDPALKDSALLYYRKFLSDAPADAAQRATATDRVKTLEKEKLEADLNGTGTPTKTEPTTTKPTGPSGKIKPAGTYSASDFQHMALDSVPPGKPIDITASVPEDSGWTVTLFYRGSGDSTFTSRPMTWRYKELVARIPAKKVAGNSIQYYLEVKDQSGAVVTRAGKSTDPNLVSIEAGAQPHFYMDMNDEGGQVSASEQRHSDEEDPLHPRSAQVETHETPPDETPVDHPTGPGDGFTDVGSKKFTYAKWGTTGAAVGLIGLGIGMYIMAGKQADNIVADSKNCGTPPCRQFDSQFDKAYQDAGHNYQTLSNVGFVVGIGAAAVAGYFWYREMSAKKHGELKPASTAASPETTWFVAPSVGDGYTGAAAMARF